MHKINLLIAKEERSNESGYYLLDHRNPKDFSRNQILHFLNNPDICLEEKRKKLIEIRRIGEEVIIADLIPTHKMMEWIFENSWTRFPRKEEHDRYFVFDVESVRFEFDRNKVVGEGRWISLRRKEKLSRKIVSSLKEIINTKVTETLLSKLM